LGYLGHGGGVWRSASVGVNGKGVTDEKKGSLMGKSGEEFCKH